MVLPFSAFKLHRIYVSTWPTLPGSVSAGNWSTSGHSGPAAANSCDSFVVSLRGGPLEERDGRRKQQLKQIANPKEF